MSAADCNKGFTLVELAIAMVVIGLLVGGILSGKELIENSHVNKAVMQIKSFDTATNVFREAHGALPGDITDAQARIPNCDSGVCSISGNGNGHVHVTAYTTSGTIDTSHPYDDGEHERFNFFTHLTKAGFLQGPEGGTAAQMAAASAYGDGYKPFFPRATWRATVDNIQPYIQAFFVLKAPASNSFMMQGIAWRPTHVYSMDSRVSYIKLLDRKMDDGLPAEGRVRLFAVASACAQSGTTSMLYTSAENTRCTVVIQADF